MSAAATHRNPESPAVSTAGFQHVAQGRQPSVLTDIHQQEINIAIWQRQISTNLQQMARSFVTSNPGFQTELIVSPQSAYTSIHAALNSDELTDLSTDMATLSATFCRLFTLEHVIVKLKVLHETMCPKFHVDNIPCRLITTYQGVATEWLPHEVVDHTKLGLGSRGLPDNASGLYQQPNDIQQLNRGDVALLKGIQWSGNAAAGLVHRSPALPNNESRLLFSIDFIH